MTKKVISLILAMVMLFSITTVTAFSATNKAGDKDYLFFDKFLEKPYIDIESDMIYYYDELYYHYDENNEIDWAIIYALNYVTEYTCVKRIVADRVISDGMDGCFLHGWALYDAETNEFTIIDEVDVTKYDDFEKGLAETKVGNPFGDADLDKKLTVMDATFIQRAVAGLCEFIERDDIRFEYYAYGAKYDRPLNYISDIDGDGERTVMDATAIQKKLANIDDSTVA